MRRLYLYLHTHWDREWYLPFENFRTKLVGLVEKVCDLLEAGELPSFYLDGQSCVLNDVLEVAPYIREKIKVLMAARRLSVGPWFVLPDQMLVSGESLVRNLKLGLKTTCQFGPPAMVGYCPDTFGHSQDLPTILAGFGIDCAIVWRGVPSSAGGPVFLWEAPSGAQVIVYHLNGGYYQTGFHEELSIEELAHFAKGCLGLVPAEESSLSLYNSLIDGALLPVGGDHLFPPHEISAVVKELNHYWLDKEAGEIEAQVVSLPEFMERNVVYAKAGANSLPKLLGELRDNSQAKHCKRAYLLPGVLSSRLYLKRQNRLTEHRLTRLCEPYFAFLSMSGLMHYPHNELEHAWKLLLLNHPHDSICGCSIDAVHDEMTIRTQRVNQVLDALMEIADDNATRGVSTIGRERTNTQAFERISTCDPQFLPNRFIVYNLSVSEASQPVFLRWTSDVDTRGKDFDEYVQVVSRKTSEVLFSGANLVPYYKEIELIEGWVWAEEVPALGYKEFAWPPLKSESKHVASVRVEDRTLVNDHFRVTIEKDGSLVVTLLDGKEKERKFHLVHELIDVGDAGDTYNFDPVSEDKPLKAQVKAVSKGLEGPLVGSLLVTYEISIPEAIVQDMEGREAKAKTYPLSCKRSSKLISHLITTEISIRRGSSIVFFETKWNNKSRDHRLEVVFKTGRVVSESYSENHFSLVKRQHREEAGSKAVEVGEEANPDRFPCQRFFIANGQVFFNSGLPEYGHCAEGVTITLLRAVSMLSRGRLTTRGGGAGPHLETPGANVLGENKVGYGWSPLYCSNADEENVRDAYELNAEYEGCLHGVLARRNHDFKMQSFFELDNKDIALSALYCGEDEKDVFIRLLNVSGKQKIIDLGVRFPVETAHFVSLDEKILQTLVVQDQLASNHEDNGITSGDFKKAAYVVEFAPGELKTIKFRLKPSS